MQGTFYFVIKKNLVCFCSPLFCSCSFLSLKENIPSMYNRTNGFESIAELLNILRLGHLRIIATKDIGPSTEIVMDYFIQRSCFHPSGSCSCRKCTHLFVISVYLVKCTELYCVHPLLFLEFKRSHILESFVCSALHVIEAFIMTASQKKTVTNWTVMELLALCA